MHPRENDCFQIINTCFEIFKSDFVWRQIRVYTKCGVEVFFVISTGLQEVLFGFILNNCVKCYHMHWTFNWLFWWILHILFYLFSKNRNLNLEGHDSILVFWNFIVPRNPDLLLYLLFSWLHNFYNRFHNHSVRKTGKWPSLYCITLNTIIDHSSDSNHWLI